ncbi:MAG: vWA domain-containing protein [Planctomycetota bacterium]
MKDFIFAAPALVHLLWLAPVVVVVLFVLDSRGAGALERFLTRTMQLRLVRQPSRQRRVAGQLLFGLTVACLVLALMRPQWGLEYVETPRAGTEIMICLDVSKSMLAADTAPNRLSRAKSEIVDLLSYLVDDHVGLVGFAGKATVLCPLTPDLGFLRLALDEAGPGSAPRGGTQIGEALAKAVEAFGDTSDVSRSILLITDGEDHDSYAVDAAKKAAEKGVKIIAIGFGDEANGSEIYVTDPNTGARTLHRDADGAPIRTRLNGEILRKIALETEGVYVPAGTGVLDLESIYRSHIAPLTRGKLDGRGREVRKEGFQLALLAALVTLLAAVAVATSGAQMQTRARATANAGSTNEASTARRRGTAALLIVLLTLASPSMSVSHAQTPPSPATAESSPVAPETPDAATPAEVTPAETPPKNARVAYNTGISALASDTLERAEAMFAAAREQAGLDVEVRFRATYNLGMAAAQRAQSLLKEKPAEALDALDAAANWFREAVRLQAKNADARHNLEVALRDALALRDQLRQQNDQDYAARLDALIERQRALISALCQMVERIAGLADPTQVESFDREFRAHATEERKILTDLTVLCTDASAEVEVLKGKEASTREPADEVREVQLTNLLTLSTRASERLGQVRRLLRLTDSSGACQRASAALTALKRARDQLRDPLQLLGVIIADGMEVLRHSGALTAARVSLESPESTQRPAAPPWLTPNYLEDGLDGVIERTDELAQRLKAGLDKDAADGGAAGVTPPNMDPQQAEEAAAREKFFAQAREAQPHIEAGLAAYRAALESLQAEQFPASCTSQQEGLVRLVAARECFFDVRALIEAMYREQRQLTQTISPAFDVKQLPAGVTIDELLPALRELEDKNIARGGRLDGLFDEELAKLAAAKPDPSAPPPPPTEPDPHAMEEQRYKLAKEMLSPARSALEHTRNWLGDDHATPPRPYDANAAHEASLRAVQQLADLRRLFLSVVELLKDTAVRQGELGDETQDVAALMTTAPDEALPKLGPLGPRQAELAAITTEIGKALVEQSVQVGQQAQAGSQSSGAPAGANPQQAKEEADRLARAGELVSAASTEMLGAQADLVATPAQVETARTKQTAALEQLVKAILLLEPPKPEDQQQQDPQQQQDQQQQNPEEGEPQEAEQQDADVQQALQGVRDREAERRRENARKNQGGRGQPVDKDW